ncbi:MAG: radical SAM/SPASM domain-containing protein, partial [bacterium]
MPRVFNFFNIINVEITNRCNKKCWMCGRRKVERDYPDLTLSYGDMEWEMVKNIAGQLPKNVVVQLHNNGEALLYPKFGEAVNLFKNQITNIVTNGKLLLEKYDEIVGNLDTLSISVFEKDKDANEQYEIIGKFLNRKKEKKPFTTLRLNGNVNSKRYEKFNTLIISRTIHSQMGSFKYRRKPTIPEIGICWDFLNHPAVNKDGEMSICVRFDPMRLGVLGNVKDKSIKELWNSKKRINWLKYHIAGMRERVPLCSYCEFWGVPT